MSCAVKVDLKDVGDDSLLARTEWVFIPSVGETFFYGETEFVVEYRHWGLGSFEGHLSVYSQKVTLGLRRL